MKIAHSIVLSNDEVNYLVSARFLPAALLQYIQSGKYRQSNDTLALELSPATAEQFRDAFTERLAKVGFDEAYEPTEEGILLEDLIDRFYCF